MTVFPDPEEQVCLYHPRRFHPSAFRILKGYHFVFAKTETYFVVPNSGGNAPEKECVPTQCSPEPLQALVAHQEALAALGCVPAIDAGPSVQPVPPRRALVTVLPLQVGTGSHSGQNTVWA